MSAAPAIGTDGTGSSLAARVDALEARAAAAGLMAEYLRAIDDGYDLAALRALFAEDATCSSELAPEVATVEDFLAFQAAAAGVVEWAFHLHAAAGFALEPGGARASGRWNVVGLHTMASAGAREPIFYSARYDVGFVRGDGGWRIGAMATGFHQISRWDRGWVEEPRWLPELLKEG